MPSLAAIFDFFLHLDKHLQEIVASYGAWAYGIIFLIIFSETGLVIAPFLPGDSLLFVVGMLAATGGLNLYVAGAILILAAVLGDAVNYSIGRRLGLKVFDNPRSKIFKREYLTRTESFYERYGGKTIIIARFVPLVRTFAPFLAGIGQMKYLRFASYNVVGAILWVAVCTLGGYFFGNLPAVRDNFSLVILLIVVVSTLPAVIEFIRAKLRSRNQ